MLQRLANLGVRARITEQGRVGLRPADRVSPELMAELRAYRHELLALVAARPPSKAWADPAPVPLERPPSDPRPELLEDSLAWAHLLAYASTDRADFKGPHRGEIAEARERFVPDAVTMGMGSRQRMSSCTCTGQLSTSGRCRRGSVLELERRRRARAGYADLRHSHLAIQIVGLGGPGSGSPRCTQQYPPCVYLLTGRGTHPHQREVRARTHLLPGHWRGGQARQRPGRTHLHRLGGGADTSRYARMLHDHPTPAARPAHSEWHVATVWLSWERGWVRRGANEPV